MRKAEKLLAIIPARSGSTRIRNKNIRHFCGKPLIAYAIEQARACPLVSRVIVDTDSPKLAAIARTYGAETPFLRPKHLATGTAQVADAVFHLLGRLIREESYTPMYILILQTTSPLRETRDIEACWKLMQETKADTVLTVAPTHPCLYHMDKARRITLANNIVRSSTNIQAWPRAYLLNGCFVYVVKTSSFLKQKRIIMKDTRAVVCDKWRSVDLDESEDWVMGEFLYKNMRPIERRITAFR